MRNLVFILCLFYSYRCFSQANDRSLRKPLTYYLPDIPYDASITTPEAFLGHQVGEWHVSHDKLVEYMKLLASQSDRIEYSEYGKTHENRPLVNLHISSVNNLGRKETIRQMSVDLTLGNKIPASALNDIPLVLYQGYTVHGNEPSGVNASMLVAYYLAAGKSAELDALLNQCYILLDPCYNPDGMQRFATWANSHKGMHLISDPSTREYNEMWPGSRTNHYWFDLNRDWLLLVHPESKARIANYHQWKPNVLTDHHEMGTNATFFFQPGVPSRTNPLTPARNQELTEMIGHYHAKALDSIGSLYYSKESFDDFYYGKGSTYPDIHGAIGILFEQASSRGHLQESTNGLLSFPFTIRNQVVTSLSTQRACLQLRNDIQEYKYRFYADRAAELQKENIQAYLFTDVDAAKCAQLIQVLQAHQVEVYRNEKDFQAGGVHYSKGNSYLVPVQQIQGRLVKTMFEKVLTFRDSLFYDVSTWTLPLAFDVSYTAITKEQTASLMDKAVKTAPPFQIASSCVCDEKAYALTIEWRQAFAPSLLYHLLNNQVQVRTASRVLKIKDASGSRELAAGSLIVPLQGQSRTPAQMVSLIRSAAGQWGVNVSSISGGQEIENFPPGHPDIQVVELPKPFTIVGQGVSSYDAGELWHYMDQRLGLPLTMIDKKDLARTSFDRYNTLILVEGSYADIPESVVKKIEEFVKSGGNIIAMGKAMEYAKSKAWIKLNSLESETEKNKMIPYEQAGNIAGSRVLGGAIFNTRADLSHPLCFGLSDEDLPLFKQGTDAYKITENSFASPLRYDASAPLLSGYSPRGFEERVKGSAAAMTFANGSGTLICFPDNLLFRGYWWGGFRVFANALFFGDLIDRSTLEK